MIKLETLNLKFVSVKIPSIILGIFAFFLVVYTQINSSAVYKNRSVFIAPPPLIEHFTFGYNEVIADSLWIRVVQDLDFCEEEVAKNTCKNNSWLYQMIDSITNLSPKFRIAYAAGGLALTVLISDIDGATKIFDKSVKMFPNDWAILYRAAYHYLYEVKDNQRAAGLLIQAADNGAPPWTRALAGRLYVNAGDLELAEQLLKELKSSPEPDTAVISRIQQRIDDMKAKKK